MLLLRAYASVWDFVNHLFGTNIPSMPPNTYGTMMAIAFVIGIFLARNELKRKTDLDIFPKSSKEIEIGKGIDWKEVLTYGLFGFIIGLKLFGIYQNMEVFLHDPQSYILSSNGSFLGGILGAVLLGGIIAYSQQKEKLPQPKKKIISNNIEDRIGDILLISMIGGVLGSKLLDAFDNPASMAELLSNPIGSLTSGLSILGGLFTVSILIIGYALKNKIRVLPFIDSLSPPFFLSYAIGRLGCQFSGDGCWGISTVGIEKPTFIPDFLWGNTYAHNVNQVGPSIPNCSEQYCHILSEPHLQTPLYETIIVLILFAILWSLRKKLTYKFGAITGLFLVFNGIERFFIEFVRVNTKYHYFGFDLSQAQYMSIIMILIGLGLAIWAIWIQKPQTDIEDSIQNAS